MERDITDALFRSLDGFNAMPRHLPTGTTTTPMPGTQVTAALSTTLPGPREVLLPLRLSADPAIRHNSGPTPLGPRSMREPDPRRETSNNIPQFKHHEKIPCHRCLFVHRGPDCEQWCVSCGTRDRNHHSSNCPHRNKFVQDDKLVSMTLSTECQRRGFNPQWQYREVGKEKYQCDLYLMDVFVSGSNRTFDSCVAARNAVAKRGLAALREMKYYLPEPGSGLPHARPLAKSKGPAAPRVSAVSKVLKDSSTSQEEPKITESVVDLPGGVQPQETHKILARAVENAVSHITFNLPANVSVEVAEAYGKAINQLAHPRSPHRRSRSQSPRHEAELPRSERRYRHRSPQRTREIPRLGSSYRPHHEEDRFTRVHDEYRPLRTPPRRSSPGLPRYSRPPQSLSRYIKPEP